jgi:hypothetical protein
MEVTMLLLDNLSELSSPQSGPARWPVRVHRPLVEVPTVGAATRLAATFPTLRRVLGRKSFERTVHRFLDEAVPRDPYVTAGGAGFSAYVAALPELSGRPFAADVARLDWAVHLARSASKRPSFDPTNLTAIPLFDRAAIVLRLRPDIQLVSSGYALSRIYGRTSAGRASRELKPTSDHERLIIYRAPDGISWRKVEAAEFRFYAALKAGRTLGMAWAAANAEDPLFDLATVLARLLIAGEVVGFDVRTKFKNGVVS